MCRSEYLMLLWLLQPIAGGVGESHVQQGFTQAFQLALDTLDRVGHYHCSGAPGAASGNEIPQPPTHCFGCCTCNCV